MADAKYTAVFSHEYDDGPSGPARSYWHIQDNFGGNVVTICLHPRGAAANPQLTASHIAEAMNKARKRGRFDKARELREALTEGERP